MNPALEATQLTLSYGPRTVLSNINLTIDSGSVTTFVGANGCGKSTLLRALGRLKAPRSGQVSLDGQPLNRLSSREIARTMAILPQRPVAPPGMTVRELVFRGRSPHQRLLRSWSRADARHVDEALARTGLLDHGHRALNSLSGGQLQRAWIALVLAQQTPIILLDEPTTYLDLTHQLDVLRLVRQINQESASTVVMVLHDLSLAARYSDRIVVLHDGGVLADAAPWQALTPPVLRSAFGLVAEVIADPNTATPLVVPLDAAPASHNSIR